MDKRKKNNNGYTEHYFNESDFRKYGLRKKSGKTGITAGLGVSSITFLTFVEDMRKEHERRCYEDEKT